ncbi:uncharacterized protein G2W53_022248 [Senna tora]|uniref:Uncharacterized protein n=1 Tax=Senna tora TaxID=362788 RepID=A0A834WP05_9FABA|nr:uncharacterized protein G2W53_022248 [Senna tora]
MDARIMKLLELPAIAQPLTQVNPTAPARPAFLLVVGFLHLKFTQVFIPQHYFANPSDLKFRENCIPQFLTQHVSRFDLRLNLLPVVEEFCNLVQCRLHQRCDWKTADPLQDVVDAFRETDGVQPPLTTTVCVLVACLHQQCPNHPIPELGVESRKQSGSTVINQAHLAILRDVLLEPPQKPRPRRFGVPLHECKRDEDDVPVSVLPHRDQHRVLVLVVQERPVHLQHRLQLPPRINTCRHPTLQLVVRRVEATQLPYTRAMAFCFPRHAFLYETVKPLAFFTVSTTSEIGMSAFSATKPAITPVIMSESSFGWSFAIAVDAQLWRPLYLEIIHS